MGRAYQFLKEEIGDRRFTLFLSVYSQSRLKSRKKINLLSPCFSIVFVIVTEPRTNGRKQTDILGNFLPLNTNGN